MRYSGFARFGATEPRNSLRRKEAGTANAIPGSQTRSAMTKEGRMEISEVIRKWLEDFDALIDRVAIEPNAVKQDGFLRRAFELAFPPKDLPSKLTFRSKSEAVGFEPTIQAHRPYYRAKTTQRSVTEPKTGSVKITSTLELVLKDTTHVVLVLKENGLVRGNAEIVNKAATLAKARKRRSEYSKSIELLFRMRQLQLKELAQVETFLREVEKRGDVQTAKYYEEDRKRVMQDIERSRQLGADL